MFADNTMIVAKIQNGNNRKIALVYNWFKENSMELNTYKCRTINTDPYFPQIKYIMHVSEEVMKVQKYIYLKT